MDSAATAAAFPKAGLMPKDETNALRFIREHPECDGRGVTIAVLDTGVDPAAVGLQTTPDGRPKIVDIVDATGSGDVVMGAEATSLVESGIRVVTGCTGRKLRLNPHWVNPTNTWRLGAKPVAELYSGALKGRITAESSKQHAAEAKAMVVEAEQRLAEWRADTGITATDASTVSNSSHRVELEELLGTLEAAKASSQVVSKSDLESDVVDVVAWHDGSTWRAALDTSRRGDMTSAPGLASFRQERQYATLDRRSQLSFALNTYDDGTIVSVVCDAGSHGTHVAGICAGHHPGSPELDGMAPGAQVVAVKIGDSRLGSMETNQGLMRGMRAVVENRCDIVNLSYGEPTAWPAAGRLIQQISDAVRRRGVLFITSAGNAGPALSTVGAPAACSSSMIAVGAVVSRAMARAGYGMRRGPDMTLYTWSSHGPTQDGSLGVSICAPGGALSPVPVWNLTKSMHFNGTSMASPNAAGCVALLLSAAKAAGIAYTPHSIRRCLENGAAPIHGCSVWGLGRGMINVTKSWTLMRRGVDIAEAEKAAQAAQARTQGGRERKFTSYKGLAPTSSSSSAASSSSPSSDGYKWQGVDDASPDAWTGTEAGADAVGWETGVVGPSRFRILDETDRPVACLPEGHELGEARGEDFSLPELTVGVAYGAVASGAASDKGVYWRDAEQSASASSIAVSVGTRWHPAVHERARLVFERRYSLKSTASWVDTAGHLTVTARGGTFRARIDPTALPAGAHYAEIRGYRVGSKREETAGPDFFVPITIVRPEHPTAVSGEAPSYKFRPLSEGASTVASTNDPDAALASAAASASAAAAAARTSAAAAIGGHRHRPAGTAPASLASAEDGTETAAHDSFRASLASALAPSLVLRPGAVERRFVTVPEGVTWCEMVVKRVDLGNDDDTGRAAEAERRARSGQGWLTSPGSTGHTDWRRDPSFFGRNATDITSSALSPGSGVASSAVPMTPPRRLPTTPGNWYAAPTTSVGGAEDLMDGASSVVSGTAPSPTPIADASSRIVVLHCVQVVPHVSSKHTTAERFVRMRPGSEVSIRMRLVPGLTLEAICGQYWSSAGSCLLTASLRFRGASLPRSVRFSPYDVASRVDVWAPTHSIEVKPSAKLTTIRNALQPKEAAIETLGERDYDEHGAPLYRLRLRYDYTAAADVDVSARVSGVQGLLYDSPHMCQGVLFVDTGAPVEGGAEQSNALVARAPATSGVSGTLAGFCDAFSDAVKLRKGRSYAIVAQLVSPERSVLESCQGLTLTLSYKLAKPITLTAVACEADGFGPARGRSLPSVTVRAGGRFSFLLSTLKPSEVPNEATPGSELVGELSVTDYSSSATFGDGKCPGGDAEVVYTVSASTSPPPAPEPVTSSRTSSSSLSSPSSPSSASASASASASSSSPRKAKGVEWQVHEAVRDASISALSKLQGEAFEVLYETLAAESPAHLPLLLALLRRRVKTALVSRSASEASEVEAVVEDIKAVVRPADVQAYFSRRYDAAEADEDLKQERKEMEERREAVKEALWAACACRVEQVRTAAVAGQEGRAWSAVTAASSAATANRFLSSLSELRDWVDTSKGKYRLVELEEALWKEQPGKALQALSAILAEPPKSSDEVAPAHELRGLRLALARFLQEVPASSPSRFGAAAARGWSIAIARFEAEDAKARVRCQHIF